MKACSPLLLALLLSLVTSPLQAVPERLFDGTPQVDPAADNAAFVWRDSKGFHVRFTSSKGSSRYHGKVCSPGRVVKLDFVTLRRQESATISPTQHCVSFNANVAGSLDGFDFHLDQPVASIEIWRDGRVLQRSKIKLGGRGVPSPGNPIIFDARRKKKRIAPAGDQATQASAEVPTIER